MHAFIRYYGSVIVKKLIGGGGSGGDNGASNNNTSHVYKPVSTSEPITSASVNKGNSSPNKIGMSLSNPVKAQVTNSNTANTTTTTTATTKDTKTEEEVKRFKRMAGLDLTNSKPKSTPKVKPESSSHPSTYDSLEYDNDDEEKSHTINMDNSNNDVLNNNLIRKVDKRI